MLARFGEAQVIGFVTQDDASELGIVEPKEDLLAVYFPMSYQIGGYTALLPRSRIVPLDLPGRDRHAHGADGRPLGRRGLTTCRSGWNQA